MKNLIFSAILAFCSLALAQQEVVDVTAEGVSDKRGAAAQKEAMDKAIEKVSLQYIEQIIGEAKTEKNAALIKNRIIKNSGKYVLFLKGSAPRVEGESTNVSVSMKVSIKNLETLLLDEGLLYKMDGPPKVLPVVSFTDRVNSVSYSWWSQPPTAEKGFLIDQARIFHLKVRKELRGRGFFGLEPVGADYRHLLPPVLAAENPSSDDVLLLGEFLKGQIVARGQIVFSTERTRSDVYRIEVKIAAHHANNGRVIGEVIRSYETDPGPFSQVIQAKMGEVGDKLASDLATQMLEAWKSGTFGASLLSLGVSGDLNYQQASQFKKVLMEQVKDIKTLKERLFEPGRVVFETDASTNSEQLALVIRQKTFPRFQVSVTQVRPDGIDLKVLPR